MEEPTAQPPAILAGDAEREHSTQLLSRAVVEGRLTLIMERVGGVTLRQWMAQHSSPEPTVQRRLAEDGLHPRPDEGLAVAESLDGKVVDWMEKVSDEQYGQ